MANDDRARTGGRRVLGASLPADVRYALRRLLEKPGFTLTAVLSLAIGIGANAAIFSLINAVILRDAPLREPGRLVEMFLRTPDFPYNTFSYPDYDDVAEGTADVFEDVGATRVLIGQIERDGVVETFAGEAVTGNYFGMLGLSMHRGRSLLPSDDVVPGAHPVLVVSHHYWQTKLGADDDAIGTDLRLSGRPFEIVGVMPPSYRGSLRGLEPAFYAPRMMVNIIQGNEADDLENRSNHSNFVTARLSEGTSIVEAQTALDAVSQRLTEEEPPSWDLESTFIMIPSDEVLLYPPIDRYVRAAAWLLSVVVGLVLLMACTNLAGFLLAQAVDRRKEVALRLALGATRLRLVFQLLCESLVLAVLGGAAGIALATAALRALQSLDLPLPLPITLDLSLDLTIVGFTLGVTVLAGIALGLAPALQASRPDLASTLKAEGAGGGQPGKLTLRSVLIGAQVATSTVLLVGAGLFLRSLQETRAIDPGFGRDPAVVMTMLVSGQRFDEDEGRRYMDELTGRFAAIPGVADVGIIGNLHLNTLSTNNLGFNVDGFEPPDDRPGFLADTTMIDDGCFGAMGISVVEGRNFDTHDVAGSRPVAIVNETLANRFFPDGATGRFLRMGGEGADDDYLIVGVASNAKIRTIGEKPRMFVYRPYSQAYNSFLTVVARTERDPQTLALEMQSTAKAFDPEFWSWETKSMERHLGGMFIGRELSATVLVAFAVLAIVLAAVGLYGIVSYAVSQRTREIGIRISLGADKATVLRLLMSTGLRPVVFGSLIGLALSIALSRLLGTLLYGVGSLDLWAFAGTVLVLSTTAFGAAFVPALRATSLSPTLALRSE